LCGAVAVVKYQQEFLYQAKQEVEPLAKLEWEESGHPTTELDIDWESYLTLEDMRKLKFFTAREGDLLVGYFVVILGYSLTSKELLTASYEAVYVHKDHRKSMVARRLFKFVEDCLKEDGIHCVIASSSNMNPIGKFLSRMGYGEVETKYEKVL